MLTVSSRRAVLTHTGGTMEYRRLGACGLKMSPICLGTMLFGARTDEAEAARIVGSARDAGINFIVTAVLAGPRTLDQWTEYLGALDHGFDTDDAALVDRLVPHG
jgi:aryl-alcohol dehydrogenase-like predicted oxidoreductase